MIMPKSELILSVVLRNQRESKEIEQWVSLINHHLPKPKRMTKRSIAHIMGTISKLEKVNMNGERINLNVKKEKIGEGIYYEFEKIAAT